MLPEYVRDGLSRPGQPHVVPTEWRSPWTFGPQLKSVLEAEYPKGATNCGGEFALLESNGRAWFYNNNATVLWGYDGQRWIEHRASLGSTFMGRCPTAGELAEQPRRPRMPAAKRFSATSKACMSSTGKRGPTAQLHRAFPAKTVRSAMPFRQEANTRSPYPPKIVNQPNIGFQNIELWSFRDNQWQKAESPWAGSPAL